MYNELYLKPIVVAPNVGRMNFKTVDFFTYFGGLILMHELYGFTNVTDSCVTFGTTQDAICKDRDEYFFWDPLHTTKRVNALLAEMFAQLLLCRLRGQELA